MKRWSEAARAVVAGVCALGGVCAPMAPAHADDWRLGATVGFTSIGWVSGVPGAGGLGTLGEAMAPGLVAGLERRLGDALWLGVDVRGAISSGDGASSSSAGAGVGLRWVLNPEDPVAVGLVVSVSGGFSAADVDGASPQSASARHAELSVGLVTDVRLTRAVELRVAASLATLGWQHAELHDASRDTVSDGVHAGLGLSPALGLGVTF